jgi:hypothetical protein
MTYQQWTKFYHSSAKLTHMQRKLFGIISIISEKKWEYNWAVHQLPTGVKDVYDSVRMEVLHNILNEFGMPMKPFTIMCLYETYINIWTTKHLSRTFPIQNGLK